MWSHRSAAHLQNVMICLQSQRAMQVGRRCRASFFCRDIADEHAAAQKVCGSSRVQCTCKVTPTVLIMVFCPTRMLSTTASLRGRFDCLASHRWQPMNPTCSATETNLQTRLTKNVTPPLTNAAWPNRSLWEYGLLPQTRSCLHSGPITSIRETTY